MTHLAGITVKTITTSRISTRVLVAGVEGTIPVIFVHGNVSSATYWEETMLALPVGYYAIAYDQRGFGGADASQKVDATQGLGDLAADLAALMETLGLKAAHLIGHSAGGSVLWRFMMDYPSMCQSVTLVNPGSPYGFGGTQGLDGKPNYADFAGSGGGTVNAAFPPLLANKDLSDTQGSPRNVMNSFYWKAPFKPVREEALLNSMFDTHIGEQDYPGDTSASANWPNVAPGKFGLINALSPKYQKDINQLYTLPHKAPILWIRGSDDLIVSDASFFDLANLGKLGFVPGYPGEAATPPQPMVSQTRAVLEKYAAAGGQFKELVIADTGHTPYIEKPEEFNHTFIEFLQAHQ